MRKSSLLHHKPGEITITCLTIATLVSIFVIFTFGCGKDKSSAENIRKVNSEDLLKVNKYLVEKDQTRIKNYVGRHQYSMQVTPSGLWYQILDHGPGKLPAMKASKGLYALIWYRSSLLDGTPCYSSEESGPKQFLIGQGSVESGLDEGIQLLQAGDSVRLIIPPHLGYGLTGDQGRIPGRSILFYELRLLHLGKEPVQLK
ncbi:MAG: FKBP-type peptidyl-prolyl cis-trans isomerase [Bacteroidales bacterium]